MNQLASFIPVCLITIVISVATPANAQLPHRAVSVVAISSETAKKQAIHARWTTREENKIVTATVWKVVSEDTSPYAVDTDEQDSYLWIRTTNKRKPGLPDRFVKVGPFFIPNVFLWVKPAANDSVCVLAITYFTDKKRYGSLILSPNSVKFLPGKGPTKGPIQINVPDSVFSKFRKKP